MAGAQGCRRGRIHAGSPWIGAKLHCFMVAASRHQPQTEAELQHQHQQHQPPGATVASEAKYFSSTLSRICNMSHLLSRNELQRVD